MPEGGTPLPGHGIWDTTGYDRQAGGTHPVGMLSFLAFILPKTTWKLKKVDWGGGFPI